MASSDPSGNPPEGSESSGGSLDQTLLESLFYNEMMQLAGDDESLLPSQFFNAVTSNHPSAVPSSAAAIDPQQLAERSLLNDFGVNALPVAPHTEVLDRSGSASNLGSNSQTQQQAAPSERPLQQAIPASVPSMNTESVETASRPGYSMPSAAPGIYPDEKRNKLVSQFATLASRLGITLPPHVLQSLSTAAAGGSTSVGSYAASSPFPVPQNGQPAGGPLGGGVAAAASYAPVLQPVADLKPAPAAVQQLESTAEAAIQAVSKKRSPDMPPAAGGGSSGEEKLTYSKRRKKPRLADCEQRLAQLKAENEVLKRHLHTVSNQSHNFDQERIAAEKRMRSLLESGATGEELDTAIKNFSEMYSDYGRHRQKELDFHLAQLQRLANPTNFTKMGLYSLENSKDPKNAVAGILQKELGITSQQGRKILEQRQKIRDVLANLKECFTLIGKLKSLCEQKTQIFHDRMNKCREILSPKQVVKLLIWIDDHSQLLETMCPGWGSEQIHTKTQQPK